MANLHHQFDELWSCVENYVTRDNVIACTVVAFSGLILYRLLRILSLRQKRVAKTTAVRRQKQRLLDQLGNNVEKNVLNLVEEITSLPLSELMSKLKKGDLKPVECVVAYRAKACTEDSKYNFVTEHIVEAEDQAEALEQSKEKGPLYGVPVSIKDLYNVKGYESIVGASNNIGVFHPEDCVLVKVLKKQGAIPFIKTNVSQTMCSIDCDNYVYGNTVNPRSTSHTPGGSSGGEAAAMAANASILGFGSDIGGSLRVPPSFCGVCGLKPSVARVSAKGILPFSDGNRVLQDSMGPIARDVDSLAVAMQSVLVPEMFRLDPYVLPLPFRDEIYKSKKSLRIGYYVDFDGFATCPASRRAVLLAKKTLEDMGHELVVWEPRDYLKALRQFFAASCFGDQGNEFLKMVQHDKIVPSLHLIYYLLRLPVVVKKFLSWILKPFSPHLAAGVSGLCGFSSIKEEWDHVVQKQHWRDANIQSWNDNKLDAVLCPSVGPALPLGVPGKAVCVTYFLAAYNLLDFTAGVLPVTKVTQADEDGMKDFPVRNMDHYFLKQGHLENTVGLPVAVQVVTLPYQDEMCLRVMKDIETGLKVKGQ